MGVVHNAILVSSKYWLLFECTTCTNVYCRKEKELGSLRLKVQCHEERILDASLYSSFVQVMLRAVETPLVSVCVCVCA